MEEDSKKEDSEQKAIDCEAKQDRFADSRDGLTGLLNKGWTTFSFSH